MSERIERLKEVVEHAHHCKAQHVCSTPVFEVFGGKVIWDGVVETFDIQGHPKAKRCYAFPFVEGDEPNKTAGKIVLDLPPVDSPETAVKVAIAAKAKAI